MAAAEERCALEGIEREVVGSLVGDTVRAVVEGLVNAHLVNTAPRKHPLLVLADNLVDDALPAMLRELVAEAVQDMVSLHFLEKRLNHDFLSMLAPAVHEVARAALFEVAVEDQVDGAMDQVMCRELAAVVRETVQELAHNVQHEKAVVERRQVARAAERIAWTSSLRVLMETLSTNGTGLFLQDHIHRMAVQLMAKRTFGLMQELESSQRELVDSPPMHEFHGLLAAGPGFDSMLLQLDEALAENEAHIHRNETHK